MARDSLKKIGVSFTRAKQSRSEKSLNSMIESAERIVATADATKFNARTLAKISGYSLGSLIQRLGKIENIFLHAIAHGRTRELKSLSEKAEAFDCEKNVDDFVEFLVSISLDAIPRVGPSVIRYYESRAIGRTKNISDIYAYTEDIVPSLLKVVSQNRTGTFRNISHYEAKYVAKALFLFLERPFAENDTLAGSEQHRQMAVNQIRALLKNN